MKNFNTWLNETKCQHEWKTIKANGFDRTYQCKKCGETSSGSKEIQSYFQNGIKK